jgi:hypothetical protein
LRHRESQEFGGIRVRNRVDRQTDIVVNVAAHFSSELAPSIARYDATHAVLYRLLARETIQIFCRPYEGMDEPNIINDEGTELRRSATPVVFYASSVGSMAVVNIAYEL